MPIGNVFTFSSSFLKIYVYRNEMFNVCETFYTEYSFSVYIYNMYVHIIYIENIRIIDLA